QHRQVRTIEDLPVLACTGQKRQVRGRPAEHVRHHNHTLAGIDFVGGRTDLGLLAGAVVVFLDRDRANAGLLANDMFDSGEILSRQPAVCDDHDTDQPLHPTRSTEAPAALRSSSRCLLDTCQPAAASVSAIFSATATERWRPPVQPNPTVTWLLPSSI